MSYQLRLNGKTWKSINGKPIRNLIYNGTVYEIAGSSEYIETGYLTFSSDSSATWKMGINGYAEFDGSFEYSTDTITWTEVPINVYITAVNHKIYLRGSNNSKVRGGSSSRGVFTFSGSNIKCEGNLETLLDYQTVLNGGHPTMANYCFSYMFAWCTNLITAPDLPAVTLSKGCYMGLFYGCSNLTTTPNLPATTLTTYCYREMFENCWKITTVPALPATVLTEECYFSMFRDCTSLTTTPKLPATTLAKKCYGFMFAGCTSLQTLPTLSATDLTEFEVYQNMFMRCSAIKLSTTKTGEYVNEYCIPYTGLAHTTVDSQALTDMFYQTGGTFTGTPEINITYYTSNEII